MAQFAKVNSRSPRTDSDDGDDIEHSDARIEITREYDGSGDYQEYTVSGGLPIGHTSIPPASDDGGSERSQRSFIDDDDEGMVDVNYNNNKSINVDTPNDDDDNDKNIIIDINMAIDVDGGCSPLESPPDNNRILNNIPQPIQHFIGNKHEEILDNIYNDITVDNMNPFIVLLGSEGIGKSCITSTICNDLLDENNQLFKNGIIYLDLMKWYKLYNLKTFEDCLINGIQECGLNTYWIQKYDDFLDITPNNIYSKLEQYLSNSLIIFEDFDRFKEINNISLDDCNLFLFHLFENISIKTKIIITSRKKLPIYYNFNLFRTKFYELESFTEKDTIDYLLTYCPMFDKQDINPYLNDIRDLTSYKPLFIYSLYKLWQNIRMFESTFDSIITLYKQLDIPQLLISHNIYNDKTDLNKIIPFKYKNNNNNININMDHTNQDSKQNMIINNEIINNNNKYIPKIITKNIQKKKPPIQLKKSTSNKSTHSIGYMDNNKLTPYWNAQNSSLNNISQPNLNFHLSSVSNGMEPLIQSNSVSSISSYDSGPETIPRGSGKVNILNHGSGSTGGYNKLSNRNFINDNINNINNNANIMNNNTMSSNNNNNNNNTTNNDNNAVIINTANINDHRNNKFNIHNDENNNTTNNNNGNVSSSPSSHYENYQDRPREDTPPEQQQIANDNDNDNDNNNKLVPTNNMNKSPPTNIQMSIPIPPAYSPHNVLNMNKPLFAYTNLYSHTPHSPSMEASYHSPLSTINGTEFSWMRQQSVSYINYQEQTQYYDKIRNEASSSVPFENI